MKSQEGNFTESELAVARYIAGHPMDVVGNTVSKVSELSGLSAAAIVRMCQRMGYSGFSEFRFEMDRQLLSNGTQEEGGANEGGLLSRFVNINAVQLRKVAESVDASLLNHVAASLCAAPRVAVWGGGPHVRESAAALCGAHARGHIQQRDKRHDGDG